jgi:hypothetical protein
MKNNKRTFADKAYTTTTVEYQDTQAKITKMLESLNINGVRFTKYDGDWKIEFIVFLKEGEQPRKVQIKVPIDFNYDEKYMSEDQKINQLFRVAYHNLKNRFVSVTNGLKEFEDEFLSDLVIMHEGKEVRIGDILAPQYKKLIKDSSVPILHLN